MESTGPQGPWKSGGVLRPRLTRARQALARAGGTGESEQPLTKAAAGLGKTGASVLLPWESASAKADRQQSGVQNGEEVTTRGLRVPGVDPRA